MLMPIVRSAALATLCLFAVATHGAEPAPAFAGQTDAPAPAQPSVAPKIAVVATGMTGAWSLAFLPDGALLVAQAEGALRVVRRDGFVSAPLAGVPGVKQVAAQGMHDVLLDPDFARNRRFYFTFTAPPAGEAPGRWPVTHWYEDVWTLPLAERRKLDLGMERVASARLSEDLQRVTDVKLLAEGAERRIALGRDGNLFVTGADRFRFYESDLDGVDHDFAATPDVRRNYSGAVLRVGRDGSIPKDNPWLSRSTVPRALYAHGLRDPEGAAVHPVTGELWTIEHGPQGGDELNRILPGKDYGWPDVSYGTQYDARQTGGRTSVPVGSGKHSRTDVEEPRYFWFPSIAPSGMMFYTGDLFPQWKGNLFVGCMSATLPCQGLVRLVLEGDKVVAEERLLLDRKQRVRDIRQAADGSIYLIAADQILRLTPGDGK